MPPRRPLPDLCLIVILKQLTPNDQLKAAQMSFRCTVLARAANRQVKSLVITGLKDYDEIKFAINSILFAFKPSMQQLKSAGVPFPDYPMTTSRVNKWNCLLLDRNQKLDTPVIELIIIVFPAVTDLKFITEGVENLVAFLQYSEWADQLINLMALGNNSLGTLSRSLFASINNLSALQCLAFDWCCCEMPLMPVFAQLKVIVTKCLCNSNQFLRSIEHNIAGEVLKCICFRMTRIHCSVSVNLFAIVSSVIMDTRSISLETT